MNGEIISSGAIDAAIGTRVRDGITALAAQGGVPPSAVLESAWLATIRRLVGRSSMLLALAGPADGSGAQGEDQQVIPIQAPDDDDMEFHRLCGVVWASHGADHGARHADGRMSVPDASNGREVYCFSHVPLQTVPAGCTALLTCHDSAGALHAELRYNAMSPDEARTLMERYQKILAEAVDHPDIPVGDLDFLLEGEAESIVRASAAPPLPAEDAPQVHELIEKRAARFPEAVALAFGDVRMTYREMNARANRLARYLRSRGTGAGVVVAIALERTVEMPIAMLAVLKSGAAYIPMEPSFPSERLSAILEDAHPAVLITDNERVAGLAGKHMRVIVPGTDAERIAGLDAADLPPAAGPAETGLVMYTSGSTGRPKGVRISRRAIASMIRGVGDCLAIRESDVYLHSASVTFILSVRQLFVPLTRGATVVIASAAAVRDPAVFFDLLDAHRITAVDVVPSYWRVLTQWLASLEESRRASLVERLVLGQIVSVGEPLTDDVVLGWRNTFGTGARLCNIYGQTETTGPVTFDLIPASARDGAPLVTIGRPTGAARTFVLDRLGRPVPPGASGELHVAGPDLADGYLDLPELTAGKFVTPSSGPLAGTRLFRTGDIVRAGKDGRLEFVGRTDFQVKVRGYRVEAGDVESSLNRHPAVAASAVVGREDEHGQNRLIAYVVVKPKASVTADALRTFVESLLPQYMVPSLFVQIPSLPRLANGKINRKGLPEPEELHHHPGSAEAPLTVNLCVPSWRRTTALSRAAAPPAGRWLIFCDAAGAGDRIAAHVRSAGNEAVTVRPGQAYAEGESYTIDPQSPAGYTALLGSLALGGKLPDQVVDLWEADPGIRPPRIPHAGVVSLARALGLHVQGPPAGFTVVTRGAQDVVGDEPLLPERGMAAAACRVAGMEIPALSWRTVDLPMAPDAEADALRILAEIGSGSDEREVAYRGGNRWVPVFEPLDDSSGSRASLLRDGGVYLFTGGYGGIALACAAEIAGAVRARFVLVGRTGFPPREEWQEFLRTHPPDDPVSARIRALQSILGRGSELLFARADAANRDQMQAVVDETHRRFGRIDGAIHAAGVSGGGLIREHSPEKAEQVLASKIDGLTVLESVIAADNPAFVLLCSSLTSLQGRVGLVDYCAANAYLDRRARLNARSGKLTIAVNWDTWDEVGMDANARRAHAGIQRLSGGSGPKRITPAEGTAAFMRILALREPQVVVTHQELAASGSGTDHAGQRREAGPQGAPGTSVLGRVAARVPPRTKAEEITARIWEEHIGASGIGATDNFFSLGGNSLIAVRVFIDLEKHFGKSLPLATLLEAPTVELLAARFSDSRWKPAWGSLVPIQPLGKNPPLYCAHGGGGNVLSFEALARHLGQDQPLYGLQSFGLDGRPPYTRVEDMAAHYLRDILEFQPEGPYFLEGMSFGGLVALEMAQMLTRQGKEVALLALLDTYPKGYTQYAGRESLWRKIELRLSEFLALERKDKGAFLGHRREEYAGKLTSLWRAGGRGGASSQTSQSVQTVWEANLIASSRYQPKPYAGRVTIFWARQSYLNSTHRFRLGWSVLAPENLEFHLVPGTHITMFEEPNVQVLAREINECIVRAMRPGRTTPHT